MIFQDIQKLYANGIKPGMILDIPEIDKYVKMATRTDDCNWGSFFR